MKSNIFALVFGETFICVNPSVKTVSQEPVLPAPLTQGSLRRSRARGFIDTLKPPGKREAFLLFSTAYTVTSTVQTLPAGATGSTGPDSFTPSHTTLFSPVCRTWMRYSAPR